MSGILINVRTELIRLIIFDLMLVLSCMPPPKEGSDCWDEPQPTVLRVSFGRLGFGQSAKGRRTSSEESIFGEYCYGVYEQDGHFERGSVSKYRLEGENVDVVPWKSPPKEKKSVAIVEMVYWCRDSVLWC